MHRVVRRLRPLSSVAALLLSAPSGFAEVTPQFKQLAGPPSEMTAMAPADPAASATHSKSALLPVKLEEDESGHWVWHSEIPVEGESVRLVVQSRASSGSPADWRVRVPDPMTNRLEPIESLAAEHRAPGPPEAGRGAQGNYYRLTNLRRGRMPVSVEATEPGEGFLLVEGAGPMRLRSHLAAFNQRVGQHIALVASVYDGQVGPSAIDRDALGTALLHVTTPDGQVHTSAMFDDGSHADGRAGDGVYGAHFMADRAGLFHAQVVVTGRAGVEGAFIRTAEHLVPVIEESMSLAGQEAKSTRLSERRVGIRLGVSAPRASGHYRVIAEVWGTSAAGAPIPVAWIGGMTAIRDGALDLGLDARWVAMAGAREPFELRNVRVEDPKYFITVATATRMPLPMPTEAGFVTNSIAPGSITVDEEMLMGPRPPALGAGADASGPAATNALVSPEYTDGTGHKLLLVHGYCSSDVWGWVKGQFSDPAVFKDFDQNRSHDEFAQRILDFGRSSGVGASSYAIVAHSQGGAAALQLYATRWSGLDNAGPGRLIQSVGTPYQGTNLAGILASIGSWFGKGCGSQPNLTYAGAATWLAGIPAAYRAKVNYYTTSFKDGWTYDYCNPLTDLVLTDPEDGVTEQGKGQLSGAVNRGHTAGWCHSVDMLDPAQYLDSARNATMSSNAAVGCYRLTREHTGSGADPVANPANSAGCPSGRYLAGATIQLQAGPSAGSAVTSWSGTIADSSTSTTNSVTMPTAARTVRVNYAPSGSPQALTVTVTGSGSVTSSTGGISCPGSCSASYPTGTLVTLTPHAGSGAMFSGWGGDCWGTSSCTLTMGSAHNVTATFTGTSSTSYTLNVSKTGTGTVTSSPSGISCGSTCSKSYASGTVVTLTASAGSGYTFSGWSGACGAAGTCTVTMSSNRSVAATFTQNGSPPPGNTGTLIRQTGHDEVYWRQNSRIYHVTDPGVLDTMQNAGMPGWGWSLIVSVSSLSGYTPGPEFIAADSRSEGLLIRQVGHDEVYWINNGLRRWVRCPAALAYLGTFPDVIEVPAVIISSKVPSTGGSFDNGCPCTGFDIWPDAPASSPTSSSGSQIVQITGTPWGCVGNWTASGDGQWLSVDLTGGSLTGTNVEDWVTVSWSANTSPSSRSSHATIANHAFPVTQQGVPPPTCSTFQISPAYHSAGPSAGQRSVTITGYPSGCQGKSWTASNGSWVTVTPSSGSGPRSVTVSWAENTSTSAREQAVSIAGGTFTVYQGPANRPPVANAGPDQVVAVGSPVTLDGHASSDPDSGPSALGYAWSQVSGPAVALSGATAVSAAFTPPSAGTYVFELRVNDGEDEAADQVAVTAAAGVASYDATLKVPRCGSVGSVCDSGSLLVGRAGLGPEPHQPNTIHGSCVDGVSGGFHSDESNDRIRVSTLDGTSFAGGKAVQVQATVWAWDDPSADSLEIYQAADASSPDWQLVATLSPTASGAQTLSATYTLPAGSLQAVRARFRWTGSAGPCGSGAYDDHDDLVFAVGPTTTQGWISGKVEDAATGLPLANVWVDIYSPSGDWLTTGATDSAGFYATTGGLPSGTYYAWTWNSQGYIDELYDDVPCPGTECALGTGTAISVTSGTTTQGIDFGLALAGRISGTVRDAATGAPLPNIGVYIFPPSGGYVASAYTDSSGVYTVTNLPAGTYYARSWDWNDYVDELYDDVPCPGWSCGLSGGAPISVTAGATRAGVDFSLLRGGRISGTLTDAGTGLPLSNQRVNIYSSGGTYLTNAYTDASGVYTSTGLPAAVYHARTSNSLGYLDELYDDIACFGGSCSVTSGAPIPVAAGSIVPASFSLVKGGRISGTITDAATGQPLVDVDVRIHDSGGSQVASGRSDGSGAYATSTGLPSGTYYASTSNSLGHLDELFDDKPCLGGSCSATAGTPIGVTAGSTTAAVDFALAPGGRIRGSVTDAGTGAPLAGVTIGVYDAAGSWVASGFTDGTGVYTTAGLPPGTYYARSWSFSDYVVELYDDVACPGAACSVTSGTPIPVTAGAVTAGVDFGLRPGGRISGTVTDAATGAPLANVTVRVYGAAGALVTSRVTSSSGTYTTTTGLPTGSYYACTSNSQGYVEELYRDASCPGGACAVTGGTAVAVTAGATTSGIDFSLAAGGRVGGRVTDAATGTPLTGVQVRVYDGSGAQLTTGTTDASGLYTTGSGLVSGTYYARTANARGYLDEVYADIPCPAGVCAPTGGTPIAVAAGATSTGIDFALGQAPVQTNDEIPGATLVSALPHATVEDTRTATTNPSDPVHTCGTRTQDSNSVWFRYVAGFTGALRIHTFNSNYDTVLTAYAGTTGVGPELACNDDTNGQQSEIRLQVDSGESYLIEVSDYGTPNGGTLVLSVTPAPPTVTTGSATGIGQYGATLVGSVNPGGTTTTTAFEYGTTAQYGGTVAAQTLTGATAQGVSAAVTGLSCATTYHFRAVGTSAGGAAAGADVTFVTAACPLPSLSVSDAAVQEGNAGSSLATFTVSLSRASGQPVSVSYTTADGTATAGSDYTMTFGLLTIPAGSVSQTVAVTVDGDRDHEPDETFFLDLSSPTNATLADARGAGTITDDDPVPALSIGDVTVRRGASGTTTAELPVTLSARTYETVTVAYATSDGTATAGTDYVPATGELSIPPGTTTATVSVTVNGIPTAEKRGFFVDLANATHAGIADGRGEATIMAEGHGFYTVTPCRAVDTRTPAPGTPLAAGVPRVLAIAGTCDVPLGARAVSLNVTVTGATSAGHVRLYPAGTAIPTASAVNFKASLTRANNAISRLGTNGELAVLLSPAGSAHLIIDVNGYFE